MGKNLISQRRGRGTMRYRSPGFNFLGKPKHRNLDNQIVTGIIEDILHCPGHYAPLIKVKFLNGEETLMISPEGIKVGDQIKAGPGAPAELGNATRLKDIPEGTSIINVENAPGDGGKFIRSSGTMGRILVKTEKIVKILMPSKKEKDFNPNCRAQIGVVAGSGRKEKPFMKAGNRYHAKKARGKLYPNVSGLAMNAVDHPFGGSSSHNKGRPTIAPRYAPAGKKVGKIRPRRTGMIR